MAGARYCVAISGPKASVLSSDRYYYYYYYSSVFNIALNAVSQIYHRPTHLSNLYRV